MSIALSARCRAALGAAALILGSAAIARAQRGASSFAVQAGVKSQADTVRVGDPFVVQVGIRAPRGATIEFPAPPDSTAVVQGLDPTRVEDRADTAATVQYAYYRVAAWDIGSQPIILGDAVVRLGGAERRIGLGGHSVFVASVLPADSAQRVPKPARPIYEFGAPLWWLYALALLVAALLLLAWWLWRRRKGTGAAVVPIDPFAHAEREFERIESLRLIEAGERGRHVALMVEALRDYLAARHAAAALALTSTELVAALRSEKLVPSDRLERLVTEADLVKFARRPITPEQARELGRDARAIVVQEHAAANAAAARAAVPAGRAA